ncbi:hypothetical protein CCB80_13705 [Armatimonadetes bacterium Uphvl-Ar1]|nr:hypothetical protein CCB80_13705 [Armatimonadetes bacterium Uphvl-Ar1]
MLQRTIEEEAMVSIKLAAVVFIFVLLGGCTEPLKERPPLVLPQTQVQGYEFVEIPQGIFLMGHELASPIHEVSLDSFWIMTKEVTEAQYAEFQKATKRKVTGVSQKPIRGVSRIEVEEYLSWLNKKSELQFDLPSEAQWEYAARGGLNQMDFPWGAKFIKDRAAVIDDPIREVGSYAPNGYGLYDMCGNVGEMTRGEYYPYPDQPVLNPEPPTINLRASDAFYVARGLGVGSVFMQVWNRIGRELVSETPSDPVGIRLVIKNDPLKIDKMKPFELSNED